jgi:hypothetical protein
MAANASHPILTKRTGKWEQESGNHDEDDFASLRADITSIHTLPGETVTSPSLLAVMDAGDMNFSSDSHSAQSAERGTAFSGYSSAPTNMNQAENMHSEEILTAAPIQHCGGRNQISGAASDRKRNRRTLDDDGALDDILGQSKCSLSTIRQELLRNLTYSCTILFAVTSKLTSLSTTEQHTEQDSIKAFTDVLNCSASEAQFYLESSNWNVETAVMLWLENNPTNSYASASSFGYPAGGYAYPTFSVQNSNHANRSFNKPKATPLYRCKQVCISDLTEGWTARVSRSSGQVYFIHLATGTTQFSVPPGYADVGSDHDTAIDLCGGGSKGEAAMKGCNNNGDSDSDGDMDDADDTGGNAVDGRMEPVSPTGLRPCTIPQNALLEGGPARRNVKNNSAASSYVGSGSKEGSGAKNRSRGSSIGGGAFRSAMDAYTSDDASDRAVWDDGSSGYSLNDPSFSVSSATNSTCDSPLFSSLSRPKSSTGILTASRANGNGNGAAASGLTQQSITQPVVPQQQQQQATTGPQFLSTTSNGFATAAAQPQHYQPAPPPPPGEVGYPLTQEPAPQAISADSNGIAMLASAPDADNTSDYFIGGYTPQMSSTNTSTGNL